MVGFNKICLSRKFNFGMQVLENAYVREKRLKVHLFHYLWFNQDIA